MLYIGPELQEYLMAEHNEPKTADTSLGQMTYQDMQNRSWELIDRILHEEATEEDCAEYDALLRQMDQL